jgi:hypothetical protein
MNQPLKNAKFWTNETTGNGQQNQTLEKASFLSENILPMQESGQLHFIKDLKTIFLKKSELGLEFSLLMDIPKNK